MTPASLLQLACCLLVLLVAMFSRHGLLWLLVVALGLVHILPETMEDMEAMVVAAVLGPAVGDPQEPLFLLVCAWLLSFVVLALVSAVALAVVLPLG